MLLLMVVAGLGFGWLQWKLKQAEKQREAVAWIEKMGGSVGYEEVKQKGWWRAQSERWFGRRVVFAYIGYPLGSYLGMADSGINTIGDLTPLASLTDLKELRLKRVTATDLSPIGRVAST